MTVESHMCAGGHGSSVHRCVPHCGTVPSGGTGHGPLAMLQGTKGRQTRGGRPSYTTGGITDDLVPSERETERDREA